MVNKRGKQRIILLEDDFLYESYLRDKILNSIRGVIVEEVETESLFVEKLKGYQKSPPSLIIMDTMLPWDLPGPTNKEAPKEISEDGVRKAGFRCLQRLQAHKKTESIPVIICSVLPKDELSEEISTLKKQAIFVSKSDVDEILDAAKELLGKK